MAASLISPSSSFPPHPRYRSSSSTPSFPLRLKSGIGIPVVVTKVRWAAAELRKSLEEFMAAVCVDVVLMVLLRCKRR